MPDIQYIVISDLHLGASNSILTKLTDDCQGTVPDEASDVLKCYVECLLEVVQSNTTNRPVTLILNGDFLELALTGTNEAAMVFERFVDLLMSDPRASRLSPTIICLAGNHDHHIWNSARETRYTSRYLANCPQGEFLRHEDYVTSMIEGPSLEKIQVDFLNALMHRNPRLTKVTFETVYPNYAIMSQDKKRCVIIHHGHFVEAIYSLMTLLKDTLFPSRKDVITLSELEAENGAWIDFFWSALGRSGQVGTDVELIYDKMQDAHQFEALLSNLAENLSPNVPPKWKYFGFLKTGLLSIFLRFILERLAKREVHETGAVLSADSKAGLLRYLEVFLFQAITAENDGTVPPHITFIFGHTHKPFETMLRAEGYPQQVQVFNSGGWVVDTLHPDPLHGASIIVIDEQLATASIRIYNERDSNDTSVRILSTADHQPTVEGLKSRLNVNSPPWKALHQSSVAAINDHRKNLKFKVNEK